MESMKPAVVQRPYFDDVGPKNVTAVVGQSALLSCRVKHPGDRTVSKQSYFYGFVDNLQPAGYTGQLVT